MSHVIVHDQTARARARLGRIAQIDALPPQLDRHAGDHWQLNRAALIRGNYRQQIRPDEITLGEQISYTFPEPEIILPPTAGAPAGVPGRPPRVVGSVAGATDQRTFFLSRSVSTPAGVVNHFAAVSSPTIPWPWVVEGIRVWDDSAFNQASFWNLSTSDEDLTGTYSTRWPGGAVLIDTNFTDPVGATVDPDASIIGPPSGNQTAPMLLAYPCGAAVFDAGARLTIIWNVVTDLADVSLYCVVTVRPAAQATNVAPSPRIIVSSQPRTMTPATPSPRAPAAAAAAAACTPGYVYINHGASYRTEAATNPSHTWRSQAGELLASTFGVCASDVQSVNDEMTRVVRNFGGSMSLIPIQVAPLIDFYRRALASGAARLAIARAVPERPVTGARRAQTLGEAQNMFLSYTQSVLFAQRAAGDYFAAYGNWPTQDDAAFWWSWRAYGTTEFQERQLTESLR